MPTISTRSGLGCSCDDLRGLGDCGDQPSTGDSAGYANWQACINSSAGNASAQENYVPQVIAPTCQPGFHWNGVNGLGQLLVAGLGACVPNVVADPAVYGPVNGQMVTFSVWQKWQTDQTAINEAAQAKVAADYAAQNELARQYAIDQAARAKVAQDAANAADALAKTQADAASKLAATNLAASLGAGSAGQIKTGSDGIAYQFQNGKWTSSNLCNADGYKWVDDLSGLGGLGLCIKNQGGVIPPNQTNLLPVDLQSTLQQTSYFGLPIWMLGAIALGATFGLYEVTKR